MTGETGSARKLRATLVLRLSFRDGRISGEGFSDPWPYDCPNNDRRVAVSGDCVGDAVYLDVRFPTGPYFRPDVYSFSGAISADGREIRGAWLYRCDTCNCAGSRGTLVLTRVAEE